MVLGSLKRDNGSYPSSSSRENRSQLLAQLNCSHSLDRARWPFRAVPVCHGWRWITHHTSPRVRGNEGSPGRSSHKITDESESNYHLVMASKITSVTVTRDANYHR